MAFEVACCLRLSDSNAYLHLTPIARHQLVSKVWIIRHSEINFNPIPKSEYIVVNSDLKIWRFIRMLTATWNLAREREVKAFVSFNPFPYGLFSLIAAKRFNRKIHFGFIGSDWNLHYRAKWKRPILRWLLRKVDHITTPGPTIQHQIINFGLDENKVTVAPHSIDLERFAVSQSEKQQYACIFLGRLIPLKNIDTILHAFARVKKTHFQARFCIVGEGPLFISLQKLAKELNISDSVDFTGFVKEVHSYLSRSKIILIASNFEGFPVTLIEAMATGLVPVTTPVGSIPDYITDNETGLFFAPENANELADRISWLLENPEEYSRLRQNVLKIRHTFSHENTTMSWDRWFQSIDREEGQ